MKYWWNSFLILIFTVHYFPSLSLNLIDHFIQNNWNYIIFIKSPTLFTCKNDLKHDGKGPTFILLKIKKILANLRFAEPLHAKRNKLMREAKPTELEAEGRPKPAEVEEWDRGEANKRRQFLLHFFLKSVSWGGLGGRSPPNHFSKKIFPKGPPEGFLSNFLLKSSWGLGRSPRLQRTEEWGEL